MAPTVRLEVVPPVKYLVADMPTTVLFSVSVKAPIDSVLAAPVNVNAAEIDGLPVSVKALVAGEFNSIFPSVAPDMLLFVPVIVILPPTELECMPVPPMFPAQVIILPPSASVVRAVSVSVVPTLRSLPSVVVPALVANVAKLLDVPGVVLSKK